MDSKIWKKGVHAGHGPGKQRIWAKSSVDARLGQDGIVTDDKNEECDTPAQNRAEQAFKIVLKKKKKNPQYSRNYY